MKKEQVIDNMMSAPVMMPLLFDSPSSIGKRGRLPVRNHAHSRARVPTHKRVFGFSIATGLWRRRD